MFQLGIKGCGYTPAIPEDEVMAERCRNSAYHRLGVRVASVNGPNRIGAILVNGILVKT